MRGIRWKSVLVPLLVAGLMSGCRSASTRRPATIVSPAPVVGEAGEADTLGAEKTISPAPAETVGFADRHPLFAKPKEYWETSGDNKIVKAAAATFIGVPAGFVGEVRQIFIGAPPSPRF